MLFLVFFCYKQHSIESHNTCVICEFICTVNPQKQNPFAILIDNSRLLPIKVTPVNMIFENT